MKLTCSKVKFVNESFALQYIDKLKKTSTRTKVPQRAYLCQHCLTWHLTSSSKNEDSTIEKYQVFIEKLKRDKELDEQKHRLEIKRLGIIIHDKSDRIRNLKHKLKNLNK